jgi:hypothetical protein
MKMLFIRLLSWLTGIFALWVSFVSFHNPFWYPFPQLAFLAWFLFAILALGGKRGKKEAFQKLVPAFLAACGACLVLLVAEEPMQRVLISLSLITLSWLPLELFFLSVYDTTHYPVHGISHINVALAPLAIFYAAAGIAGLRVFVDAPWWLPFMVLIPLSAVLFTTTEHPIADVAHRRRWRWIGALIGAHLAVFLIILPINLWAQGVLAALFFALPLRLRRYAFATVPSHRVTWIESSCGIFLLLFILLATAWA